MSGAGENQNRTLPLAFLHVFKTGGTTASNWIHQRTAHLKVLAVENPLHIYRVPDADDYDVIRGHIAIRMPETLRRPRVLFTIVREPEACLMSALWHLASADAISGQEHPAFGKASEPALTRHALKMRETGAGLQSFYFVDSDALIAKRSFRRWGMRREFIASAAAGIDRVHIVGLTERLQDSLRLLAWRMRWPAPRGIGTARQSGAGASRMPLHIRFLLRHHLAIDRALYARATDRFAAEFAALTRAAGSVDAIDSYLDHHAAG